MPAPMDCSVRLRRWATAVVMLHTQPLLLWPGLEECARARLESESCNSPERFSTQARRFTSIGALAAESPGPDDPEAGAAAPQARALHEQACATDRADGDSCSAAQARPLDRERQLRWRGLQYTGHDSIYAGKLAEEAFAATGFEGPIRHDGWDLLFTHWPMVEELKSIELPKRPARLVNNCMRFMEAGDKCRLAAHIHRIQSARADAASAGKRPRHLRTFRLADQEQAQDWQFALQAEPERVWLLKTCIAGHSEGISFVSGRDKDTVSKALGTYSVAQEFVDRPHLGFGGRKYHLRLYVLVTRWDPVAAFLYTEGLIFRSRHAYDSKHRSGKRDLFSGISRDVEPLPLQALWQELGEELAVGVQNGLVDMFAELFGTKVANDDNEVIGLFKEEGFGCFDLFGADVMLDESLEPLLLEVNMGPNMWVDGEGQEHEPLLRHVKQPLMWQLARWAALRLRSPPGSAEEAEAIEDGALPSFLRVTSRTGDAPRRPPQARPWQPAPPPVAQEVPAARGGPPRWRGLPYGGPSGGIYAGSLATEVFAAAGFEGPVTGHDWDVLFTKFTMGETLRKLSLPPRPDRLVSHCEYFRAAGSKCRLARHMRSIRSARGASGAASAGKRPRHLRSFVMMHPDQVDEWKASLRAEPDRLWLAKPCTNGRSEGISFVSGRDMDAAMGVVNRWIAVQEYVDRPYLGFGGRKFHLRLFVLVTRWDPVGAFLYDEGLIFRSRHAYDGRTPSAERDIFSAIAEDVEPLPLGALWRELGEDLAAGVKAGLVELFAELFEPEALAATFGDPAQLARRGYGCFDLFGVDVMLDEALEPLLLEVNLGPDLNIAGEASKEGHEPLLRMVKAPLLEQLARWAALRVRSPPRTADTAEAIERQALQNFTRIV